MQLLLFSLILMGINSCAQDKGVEKVPISSGAESDDDFYDALRLRSDLSLGANKRILYTTIKRIEAFETMYKDTDMQLEFVIRDQLHTAIYLNQEKNYLESMDGSRFNLSPNLSASLLTDEVVDLIGSMYYGAAEVEALKNN